MKITSLLRMLGETLCWRVSAPLERVEELGGACDPIGHDCHENAFLSEIQRIAAFSQR